MSPIANQQILYEEMDGVSQEESQSNFEGSIDTMKEARSQRKRNKMANTIGNQSAMNSQTF